MKPLVIINQDPEIKDINTKIEEGRKSFKTALEFMEKQAAETHKNLIGIHWDEMEAALMKKGLLPKDYNKDNYGLSIAEGVLYLVDRKGCGDCRD